MNNCPQCQQLVKPADICCENCDYPFALVEQNKKLRSAVETTQKSAASALTSPLFLVSTIIFTVFFAAQTLSVFLGNFGGILPAIFMLVSMISMWSCYSARTRDRISPQTVVNISIFDVYNRVIYIILLVGIAILAFFLAMLSLEYVFDDGEGFLQGFIFNCIQLLVIGVVAFIGDVYAERRKFFKTVAAAAETGSYSATKAPVGGTCFLGISSVIISVGVLDGPNDIFDLLKFLEFNFKKADPEEIIVALLLYALSGSGILMLISGVYYIISSVWIFSTHGMLTVAQARTNKEISRRDTLERASRQLLAQREAARKAEAEARARTQAEERKKAELELRQNHIAMQEQQQLMMQLMMQQMINQNPEAFSAMMKSLGGDVPKGVFVPDAAPAPDEAPVPDAAPAPDEAPVPDAAPVPGATSTPDAAPASDEAPDA